MKQSEWTDAWVRIRDRFPLWQPTQTEGEDFCIGLRVYPPELVEEVGQWVTQTYSSREPKLAWYVRECEKRRRAEIQSNAPAEDQSFKIDTDEYVSRREAVIVRLEETSIDELRTACVIVLEKYGHLIETPTSGKPREWKSTLRSLVHIEIFGGQDD